MSPTFVAHNIMNALKYHAVLMGDIPLAHSFSMQAANFEYIQFSQFRHTVTLAALLSFFVNFVCYVVGVCTKKQMGRIHTRWIVACRTVMENVQAIWNRAEVNLPGNAVSMNSFSARANIAMTKWGFCASPEPTFVGAALIDFLPEAVSNGSSKTMMAYVAKRLALYMAESGMIVFGEFGFLSTTTVAVAIRNFLRRLGRGMIVHSIVSFQTVLKPGSYNSPGTLHWFYQFIIPQVG